MVVWSWTNWLFLRRTTELRQIVCTVAHSISLIFKELKICRHVFQFSLNDFLISHCKYKKIVNKIFKSNTRVSSEWLIKVASESIEHAAWPINWSEKQTISIYGSPRKYRILYESVGSHYVATHSRTRRFNAMHH